MHGVIVEAKLYMLEAVVLSGHCFHRSALLAAPCGAKCVKISVLGLLILKFYNLCACLIRNECLENFCEKYIMMLDVTETTLCNTLHLIH